jgi:hypothetical protein
MKKAFIGLLILVLSAWAQYVFSAEPIQLARMNPYVAGGAGAASTTYTDCSQIGSHAFVYFGDYTGDTDKGCKGSSTALDGTLSGATVVAGGTDPGTASPTSAGNVLKLAASNDYLRWSISSGDIFSSSEGQACFDFYLNASTGANTMYLSYTSARNIDKITFISNNTVAYTHIGNSVNTTMVTSAKFNDATWTHLCVRWSVSNNQIGIKVGEGSWEVDADADDVTAHATEPSYVYAGYGALTASEYIYIDNLTIDKASGI